MLELFDELSVICCDDLDNNNVDYTYENEYSEVRSFIDYVFVATQLA